MVNTPVLYMTFSRPDYARRTFDAIKAAKPKILYFYSNKARIDRPEEIKKNNEIRNYLNEIDWECDLHIWLRDEYVDVYTSLLSAKKWAFEKENSLIMLEEDCLASLAFFQFCDYFLEKYKNDKRINYICGNNYALGYEEKGVDHYITRTIHHHGWATWKDRWESIDWRILPEDIINNGALKKYFKDVLPRYFYFKRYYLHETEFIKKTGCWDYIKVLNQISKQQYAITPIMNLVQNVGISGVHESGDIKLQFTVGNNSDIEKYPFTGGKEVTIPNRKYDVCESRTEGLQISFWHYYLSCIYHFFKK